MRAKLPACSQPSETKKDYRFLLAPPPWNQCSLRLPRSLEKVQMDHTTELSIVGFLFSNSITRYLGPQSRPRQARKTKKSLYSKFLHVVVKATSHVFETSIQKNLFEQCFKIAQPAWSEIAILDIDFSIKFLWSNDKKSWLWSLHIPGTRIFFDARSSNTSSHLTAFHDQMTWKNLQANRYLGPLGPLMTTAGEGIYTQLPDDGFCIAVTFFLRERWTWQTEMDWKRAGSCCWL